MKVKEVENNFLVFKAKVTLNPWLLLKKEIKEYFRVRLYKLVKGVLKTLFQISKTPNQMDF